MFDKFGKPFPQALKIGAGTDMSISFLEPVTYYTDLLGAGVKALKPVAAMVHELVEYSGGSASDFGFDVEEDDEEETEAVPETAGSAVAEGGDDGSEDF